MIRGGSLLLILMATLLLGESGMAQSLRLRTEPPVYPKEDGSSWGGAIRYSMATDYANTVQPRGYTNLLMGDLTYQYNKNWSAQLEAGGRAEFFDGQIDKGSEQSYDETLSATTSLELDYEGEIADTYKYSFFVHGEPLWDEASRLEGYKALLGGGGDLKLLFFGKRFSIGNSVDVTELLNTYRYGSDLSPNPDYFITYKISTALKLFSTWKIGYSFGLKTTRYLDGFWGYNYENAFSLAKSFGNLSVALTYSNGGFTDDGTVKFWYLDEYRRVASLKMNYTF